MVILFDDPSIIGKRVLIGVAEYDPTGQEVRRSQWWGTILAFNRRQGLLVDLEDSEAPLLSTAT